MENNKIKKFIRNIGVCFAVATSLLGCVNMLMVLFTSDNLDTETVKVLMIVASASTITLVCIASVFGFLTLWYRINKLEKKLLEK